MFGKEVYIIGVYVKNSKGGMAEYLHEWVSDIAQNCYYKSY